MPDGENSAVLTLEERGRIAYHLGYLITQPITSIQLGSPRLNPQSLFLVQSALDRIPESQVGQVRRLVSILDSIEAVKLEAISRLAASKVDEITLNADEQHMLNVEYTTWADRLGELLGVPLNPLSNRFVRRGPPLNSRVRFC